MKERSFPEDAVRQTKKSDRTRELILATAARLFRKQGHKASTLRKIAKISGLKAGSIYYHFGSKEEILDEVLEYGMRGIHDAVREARLRAASDRLGFRETFMLMVHTHLSYLLDASDFTSAHILNFPTLPAEVREKHRPLRRAYSNLWDEFLNEALDAGDLRTDVSIALMRQFMLGALNWTVEWYDATRRPVSEFSVRVSNLFLDGMTTQAKDGVEPVGSVSPHPLARRLTQEPEPSKLARTRAQILSASARLLHDQGIGAMTLRKVAAEVGLEAGSIYYHFSSKEEIVNEVLERGLRDMLTGLSAVLADDASNMTWRGRIEAGIHAHLMYLFEFSEFTAADLRIFGQLPEKIRSRHSLLRRAYAELWDNVLTKAQNAEAIRRDIEPVALRQAMLGALNWTVEWFDPKRTGKNSYTLAEMIRLLQALLMDGILSQDNTRRTDNKNISNIIILNNSSR